MDLAGFEPNVAHPYACRFSIEDRRRNNMKMVDSCNCQPNCLLSLRSLVSTLKNAQIKILLEYSLTCRNPEGQPCKTLAGSSRTCLGRRAIEIPRLGYSLVLEVVENDVPSTRHVCLLHPSSAQL